MFGKDEYCFFLLLGSGIETTCTVSARNATVSIFQRKQPVVLRHVCVRTRCVSQHILVINTLLDRVGNGRFERLSQKLCLRLVCNIHYLPPKIVLAAPPRLGNCSDVARRLHTNSGFVTTAVRVTVVVVRSLRPFCRPGGSQRRQRLSDGISVFGGGQSAGLG